jgi:hypothetical protein
MTDIKKIKDTAFVLSVHEGVSSGTSRINLKWQGNHEIFDFALNRIGKVMNCATETENTGWVMIENSRFLKPGDAIPLG